MTKLNIWLQSHRVVNILILLLYFLAVVLPHKRFGAFLNDEVFAGITRDQYNLYVLIAGSVLLFAYAIYFYINSRNKTYRNQLWVYMLYNIVLAVIVINVLFVINIEMVHFPQYAVFAILLFPLINNYMATLIWSTLAGALDEAYQYFILAPNDTFYYDFNDVVTNLVGATFGLLIIWSAGIAETRSFKSHQKSIYITLLLLAVLLIVLNISKVLSIYPSEDHVHQLLSRELSGFWYSPNKMVTFHVMRPLEGVLVTVLLTLSMWRIGKGNPIS